MENEPKATNSPENGQNEKGKYREGETYNFEKPLMAAYFIEKREDGGGANIPVPIELQPGKYKYLGFSDQQGGYIFSGKPNAEDAEDKFVIPPENLTRE